MEGLDGGLRVPLNGLTGPVSAPPPNQRSQQGSPGANPRGWLRRPGTSHRDGSGGGEARPLFRAAATVGGAFQEPARRRTGGGEEREVF